MQLRIFQSFSPELEALWRSLEEKSHYYCFQSYRWLEHWYTTIGREASSITPCLVVLEDSDGPQALLPFGLRRWWGLRILTFIGGNQSDYHSPIATNLGQDALANSDCWQEILSCLPKYDVIHLTNIPEHIVSAGVFPLKDIRVHATNRAYAAVLPLTWEEYLAGIRGRIKSDSRRQRRRLAQHGKLSFEVLDIGSDSVASIFDIFVLQKRARYQATGVRDILVSKNFHEFYKSMPSELGPGSKVHFSALFLDDHVLATHWGATDNERFYYLMPAFSPDWVEYSPGRLLLEHLIEWSIVQDLKIFDFTIGDEQYKKDWSKQEIMLYEILQPKSIFGSVYIRSLLARRYFKKTLVPKRGRQKKGKIL